MNEPKSETVGGYKVVRQLGSGGMASVFEVEHPTLGTHLAMKVFNASGERAEFLRARFRAEGRVLARLSHPNLVRVHDFGFDEATGSPYMTMDLVLFSDGEPRTLSSLHARHEMDEEQLFRWYADVASALGYIHSQGIVHRDVKPSNILIAADGRAVLADFGVSRFCDEGLKRELSVEPTMVTDMASANVILGTVNYLAPEVKRGEAATEKSDIYSLGVALFRIITGIWYEPGTDALSLLAPFDPAWKDIFSALLAEDPAARSMPPRRRRKVSAALVSAIVLAVAAVAAAAAIALAVARRTEPGSDVAEQPEEPPAPAAAPSSAPADAVDAALDAAKRTVEDLFFAP